MNASDIFLLIVRWVHLVSATVWVGGSIFYLLILRPVLKKSQEHGRNIDLSIADEFRALIDTMIFVLLTSGIILSFNRLTPGIVGPQYALVLGLKISLSIWMFILARDRRRKFISPDSTFDCHKNPLNPLRKILRSISRYNALVILGLIVFLLADALNMLFEAALTRQ